LRNMLFRVYLRLCRGCSRFRGSYYWDGHVFLLFTVRMRRARNRWFCMTSCGRCAHSARDDNRRGDWARIVTLFGLFAAHEFHQFGLCLTPILVSIVIASARLVD
jgi:hypothetical protein